MKLLKPAYLLILTFDPNVMNVGTMLAALHVVLVLQCPSLR